MKPGGSPLDAAVREAIARFLDAFKPYDEPLSIRAAVAHVFAAVPECPLTERQVADLVARHAVDGGYNIHFDAGQ